MAQDPTVIPIDFEALTPKECDALTAEDSWKSVVEDERHVGYPLVVRGQDLNTWRRNSPNVPPEWDRWLSYYQNKFRALLGAKASAVHMYYPPEGCISWHTNENAPGKNLILTYSEDGQGWFRYRDPKTGEIVTIHDDPGWNAKMGEFGSAQGTKVWHCARNHTTRLTLGYIIADNDMWDDVREELEEA